MNITEKIESLLNSDLTSYQIAKYVGDKSIHHIQRLRKGESKIMDIPLGKALKLVDMHDKWQKGDA